MIYEYRAYYVMPGRMPDVQKRFADLDVPESELARRRAQPSKWSSTDEQGWLSIYRELVGPLNKGAVLKS